MIQAYPLLRYLVPAAHVKHHRAAVQDFLVPGADNLNVVPSVGKIQQGRAQDVVRVENAAVHRRAERKRGRLKDPNHRTFPF